MVSGSSAQAELAAWLQHIPRALRRLANERLAVVCLSDASAWPLVMIHRKDGMRQNALAEMLAIEGPSLVPVLDQLCDAGWVQRREDPADRRAKTLHVTAPGAERARQAEELIQATRAELLHGVTANEMASCLGVLRRLGERLGVSVSALLPERDAEP